jgi:hypothetical protein
MLSFIWRTQPTSEPQFADYPTPEAYREAWYTWRAIQRDGRLNPEEMAAQWEVIEDTLKNRLYG